MRKVIITLVLLLSGSIVGIFFVTSAATSGGMAPPTLVGGDANGNGRVEIADVSYLANFIFLNGPTPAACADSPELLARVEDLETRVLGLEGSNADLIESTDLISEQLNEVSTLASKTVLFTANRISVDYIVEDCEGAGDAREGPATLDGHGRPIEVGTISDDTILFQTDRDSDLLFEFEYQLPQSGRQHRGFTLLLDGEFLTRFGVASSGLKRAFALDVPAGQHTLAATGTLQCSTNDPRASVSMVILNVVAQKLD